MTDQTYACHALTIDPVHVGTGGYRLGRVDNTIVREPGTNLPKIPGSSIAGVCRHYAIHTLENNEERSRAEQCAADDHDCGTCTVCRVFGYATGDSKTGAAMGRVRFHDARLLAFPVRTMFGPCWVTTAELLGKAGLEPPEDRVWCNFDVPEKRINLGWLYLDAENKKFSLPGALAAEETLHWLGARLALLPGWLFAEVVNANLEVRTSVSIDFETGTARDGALFTYEAIPRATLLRFDVVVDRSRCQGEPGVEETAAIVGRGLAMIEVLGIGGMNTRGFGRMRLVGSYPGQQQGGGR